MALELAVHHQEEHYVDGAWTSVRDERRIEVLDPATELPVGSIPAGDAGDVLLAVAAARAAARGYAAATRAERGDLLRAILHAYDARADELASVLTREAGVPVAQARGSHVERGREHLRGAIEILASYPFCSVRGTAQVVREPAGVCALITPCDQPVDAILRKVAPALAAGCTVVLKPSEIAPLNALLLAEVMDAAGVPAGVFNLVNGEGRGAGAALASHPAVDVVSFTGSTRTGIQVATAAAASVKRVTQQLGGKSPAVVLDDAHLQTAVEATVAACFAESGQVCDAPSRLLVPAALEADAAELAAAAVERLSTGDPQAGDTDLGPVATARRFLRVQTLIESGIRAGARLVTGGPGRPHGFEHGWFVRPTVFTGVDQDMALARAEVLGPVLSILSYRTESDAVRIANDSEYGLAAYVWSADRERARRVAGRLSAGRVTINGAPPEPSAPLGGYRQSGNGREGGVEGLETFLEAKTVLG